MNFDDLVGDPERAVADIYRRLGFEIGPAFVRVLREAAERARHYHSRHRYSLEQVGLTRERIVVEFADVFERFGFDTRGDATETGARTSKRPGCTERRAGRRAKVRFHRTPRLARRDWGRGEV